MPQVFQVVRCFACSVFQVQQVKKVPKWVCKMCGEKQSLKKEYGRGSGADCRRHVQNLNMMKASMEDSQPTHTDEAAKYNEDNEDNGHIENSHSNQSTSVWNQFIDEAPSMTEEPWQASDNIDTSRITTDRDQGKGKGRKRGGNRYSGQKRKWKQDEPQDHPDPNHRWMNDDNSFTEDPIRLNKKNKASMSSHPYTQTKANTNPKETTPKLGRFVDGGRHGNMEKSMSSSAAARPSTSSKWGHYLTDDLQENDDGHQRCSSDVEENPVSSRSKWGHYLTENGDGHQNSYLEIEDKPVSSRTTTSSGKWDQFTVNSNHSEETDNAKNHQQNCSDVEQIQVSSRTNSSGKWDQFTVNSNHSEETDNAKNHQQNCSDVEENPVSSRTTTSYSKWDQFTDNSNHSEETDNAKNHQQNCSDVEQIQVSSRTNSSCKWNQFTVNSNHSEETDYTKNHQQSFSNVGDNKISSRTTSSSKWDQYTVNSNHSEETDNTNENQSGNTEMQYTSPTTSKWGQFLENNIPENLMSNESESTLNSENGASENNLTSRNDQQVQTAQIPDMESQNTTYDLVSKNQDSCNRHNEKNSVFSIDDNHLDELFSDDW